MRLSAPAGFGRRHVAPLLPVFIESHPDVTVTLDLSDRLVDWVNEGFDCAIRLGELPDSSLVSLRLGENRRVCVAAPAYLARRGTPESLDALARHNCLAFGSTANQQRGWTFAQDGKVVTIRVNGTMECTDGAVLHDWCLDGYGLAWRSWWEVGDDIRAGRLVTVLDAFAAPPIGIHAVFPQRRHLPLRVRLFIDHLKHLTTAVRRIGRTRGIRPPDRVGAQGAVRRFDTHVMWNVCCAKSVRHIEDVVHYRVCPRCCIAPKP